MIGHSDSVMSLILLNKSPVDYYTSIASSSLDMTIKIWDIQQGICI